jgi:hypothetical protein
MRNIAEIAQETFGVSTRNEADKLQTLAMLEPDPLRTTPTHLSIPYTTDTFPKLPPDHEFQEALNKNILHERISMNYVFRIQDMVVKIGAAQQIIKVSSSMNNTIEAWLTQDRKQRIPSILQRILKSMCLRCTRYSLRGRSVHVLGSA